MVAEQDRCVTFASIAEFVRRMSSLPGQRELILVSPGFALPLDDPQARDAESRVISLAAESNVTISALNARGVFVSGPSPSPAEENVLAELAYGAGGEFFHGSNDFDAGFKALTEAPEIVYLLELSSGGVKPDGIYHRLKVKVDRGGVQLEARRGYSIPKAEKTTK
jgi:VWFA-related protein